VKHSRDHSAKVTTHDARAIEQQATALLAEHPHFRGRTGTFEFECRQEILIVRGNVPSFYLKQLLQTALRDVEGVARIDIRVDVVSCSDISSVRPYSIE
jgi:hypothetical protein